MFSHIRSDNFESSLTTLLQLGTSALKVGLSAVGEQGAGGQFASKVGLASSQLSPEEILHKQQVRGQCIVMTEHLSVNSHLDINLEIQTLCS